MWRRLTASAVFGLGLLALTASGQQPAQDEAKKAADAAKFVERQTQLEAERKRLVEEKEKKAAGAVDAQIAAALANDPDVRMARAKLQLAEAELAKARQQVTQKVVTLHSAIAEQKKAMETAEQLFKITEKAWQSKQGSYVDLLQSRQKLEAAQAKLAQLETELKLLTGDGPAAVGATPFKDVPVKVSETRTGQFMIGDGVNSNAGVNGGIVINEKNFDITRFPTGPIPDRIRAALDKKVKLAGDKMSVRDVMVFFKREAGLDVALHIAQGLPGPLDFSANGEELPVGAWLQLFQDSDGHGVFYVREYGLLLTSREGAPPDAITLIDFWKQKPAPKDESKK